MRVAITPTNRHDEVMQRMTTDELNALPLTVDVVTAGRAFGIGRDVSYRLARRGDFPVPVLRAGKRFLVTKAALLGALGLADPGKPLDRPASPLVSASASDARSHGQGHVVGHRDELQRADVPARRARAAALAPPGTGPVAQPVPAAVEQEHEGLDQVRPGAQHAGAPVEQHRHTGEPRRVLGRQVRLLARLHSWPVSSSIACSCDSMRVASSTGGISGSAVSSLISPSMRASSSVVLLTFTRAGASRPSSFARRSMILMSSCVAFT